MADWQVFLDANDNRRLDAGEDATMTDADGNYTFAGLTPGNYLVREVLQSGWLQTSPWNNGGIHVTAAAGQSAANRNFGIVATAPPVVNGSISGVAFNDSNGNGVRDAGESVQSGIIVFIDANDSR